MISIVIVTFNSRRCIGPCLQSLQGRGAEVAVVDNASTDGTAEETARFPWVRLVAPGRNLGFAAACNLGARRSSGDALLFLNPDTVYLDGTLGSLEQVLANSSDVAAVAPQLVDDRGQFQRGFAIRRLSTLASLMFEILLLNRLFPGNPLNRRDRCLDFDPTRQNEVEQPAGACLLVRRSMFEACGGFDERFFPLWFEDVDLCVRIRQRGGRILYCPSVRFEHTGAHSLAAITDSERQVYWYRNLLYYVRKHYGGVATWVMRGVILAGLAMRTVVELGASLVSRKVPRSVRANRIRAYEQAMTVCVFGRLPRAVENVAPESHGTAAMPERGRDRERVSP